MVVVALNTRHQDVEPHIHYFVYFYNHQSDAPAPSDHSRLRAAHHHHKTTKNMARVTQVSRAGSARVASGSHSASPFKSPVKCVSPSVLVLAAARDAHGNGGD